MIDEARQIAFDFGKQPELLEQTSGRSEVATSPEDDKPAKLETSYSPEDAPQTRRLPRAAQLPPVAGLPLVEAPTWILNASSFEPDGLWMSTPLLRRLSDPFSIECPSELTSRARSFLMGGMPYLLAKCLVFAACSPRRLRESRCTPSPTPIRHTICIGRGITAIL